MHICSVGVYRADAVGERPMKLLATGAAILVVLAVSSQARAAEFLKAEVNPVDIRTGGDLTGCGLEYSGVFRDHTYRSGALSGVSGTINIMRLGKANLGLFFKIGLVDWLDPEMKQAKIAKIECCITLTSVL